MNNLNKKHEVSIEIRSLSSSNYTPLFQYINSRTEIPVWAEISPCNQCNQPLFKSRKQIRQVENRLYSPRGESHLYSLLAVLVECSLPRLQEQTFRLYNLLIE